jgi:tRNA pseudouridine38-40 synthase
VSTPHVDEPATADQGGGFVRLRLDLAYDGREFSGWASQPGRRTVQQTVEESLATVLRLPSRPGLTVAGRTDAGVHARGQVAHADVPADGLPDPAALARRIRGVLPDDVVVSRVTFAPDGFDARFSALGRRYHYRVTDHPPDPVRRADTVAWDRPLDVAAMNAAAAALVGEHDFLAYCRPREGATTIRRLRRLEASRDDAVVTLVAEADAFCHHQVRSLVGALLAVGCGRRPVGWPADVLAARVRDSAVTIAPAHGLTLMAVDYPPDDELAERARQARQRRGEGAATFVRS